MEGKVCGACKKKVVNDSGSVTFPCPGCAKAKIVRCTTCRRAGIGYTCSACEFKGPN